ncbi:unnamed protein product [Mytilus edulis]|uniref:Uncharacterized protein n=1 Tax=Mytilus edulis TaxID=6550 RepID=A0A8S3RNU6_MYTED|nr:unnamed protein product [Mytilus edulis]
MRNERACSSEGNDIKEEGFDNFNHFKINSESFSDNHDNTTCASCKSERQKCEDKQVFVRSGDNSAICKNKTILKGDNCIQGTEQLDGSHLGRVLDQSRPLQSEDSSRSVENLNGTSINVCTDSQNTQSSQINKCSQEKTSQSNQIQDNAKIHVCNAADLSSAEEQTFCDSSVHNEAVKNNKKKSTLHLDCSQTVPMETNQLSGTFSPAFKREKPLCKEEFEKMFDEDGRIVDEHALRKAVFMGGVEPSIRKKRKRDILIDYMMKYHEQKSRWKTMLVLNAKPGASLLEQGLVARYQIDTTNRAVRSPDGEFNDPISGI